MVPETSNPHEGEQTTASLFIHLEEGFDGDVVRLRVAGQTVLDREDVSTNYSVGLAAVIETDVAKGPVDVELTVPTRDLVDRTTWDVEGTFYLAVRIIDDEIRYRTSDEPFLYL
jgi:hypothetical protein